MLERANATSAAPTPRGGATPLTASAVQAFTQHFTRLRADGSVQTVAVDGSGRESRNTVRAAATVRSDATRSASAVPSPVSLSSAGPGAVRAEGAGAPAPLERTLEERPSLWASAVAAAPLRMADLEHDGSHPFRDMRAHAPAAEARASDSQVIQAAPSPPLQESPVIVAMTPMAELTLSGTERSGATNAPDEQTAPRAAAAAALPERLARLVELIYATPRDELSPTYSQRLFSALSITVQQVDGALQVQLRTKAADEWHWLRRSQRALRDALAVRCGQPVALHVEVWDA